MKEFQEITVSRANLVAWVASGLNALKVLKGKEINVCDIDFNWGWQKDDTIKIAIVYKKRKEGRARYRKFK